MPEPKENLLMEKIVSLCKRRGFIFQSSEIYGGINGFWDYGPMGAELKRNVKESWWLTMTRQREDVVRLEAPIIMSPQIWKASGHVATFADLMGECPITNELYRADQVEPQSGTVYRFSEVFEASIPLKNLQGNNPIGTLPENYRPRIAEIESVIQKSGFTSNEIIEIEKRYRATHPDGTGGFPKAKLSILLPKGKPIELAIKKVEEFAKSQGVVIPFFWLI